MSLKEMRTKRGLSQAQLADKSGVSVYMIQQYEQGFRNINGVKVTTAIKLADALECSVKDLINRGENGKVY